MTPTNPGFEASVPAAAEEGLDAELREEFEHHLHLLQESERAAGVDEAAAAELARRRFGDPARYVRACKHIVLGVPFMQRKLLIAWNIVLTVALCVTFLVAKHAYDRAIGPLLASPPTLTAMKERDRKAILRSLWGDTAGMIEVKGAVARPGSFQTSLDAPLGVAALVEMAGGAKPEAKLVVMKRPDLDAEAFVSLKSASKHREETQLMPEPGSVIEVR